MNSAKTMAVTKSGGLTVELAVDVKYASSMGVYAMTKAIHPAHLCSVLLNGVL